MIKFQKHDLSEREIDALKFVFFSLYSEEFENHSAIELDECGVEFDFTVEMFDPRTTAFNALVETGYLQPILLDDELNETPCKFVEANVIKFTQEGFDNFRTEHIIL